MHNWMYSRERNPYWCLYRILFAFKNDINVLYIIFSNSLEKTGRKLTGRNLFIWLESTDLKMGITLANFNLPGTKPVAGDLFIMWVIGTAIILIEVENNCSYYSGAIMKHVREMNKYFRNHHKPCTLLSAHKDSCWMSQLLCLNTLIKNRSFYVQISQDYKSIIQKI